MNERPESVSTRDCQGRRPYSPACLIASTSGQKVHRGPGTGLRSIAKKWGVGSGDIATNQPPTTQVKCRRCPTLPHPTECSTIGAEGLSFRVRNGTGRFPNAKTTDNTIQI